jgi:tripartite-type tricarboxylate transporter receptor subunit TctC
MLQADSTGWRPLVDAGKLRLLMVWTSARSPNFPNVPTLKELGYSMVYDSPFGIAGPKGMDPKIVAKLHDAFKKALDDPAVIATLANSIWFRTTRIPKTTRSSSSRSPIPNSR